MGSYEDRIDIEFQQKWSSYLINFCWEWRFFETLSKRILFESVQCNWIAIEYLFYTNLYFVHQSDLLNTKIELFRWVYWLC